MGANDSNPMTKMPLDDEMLQGLMELAGVASLLIGGPYASLGYSVLKVLKVMSSRYETPPELQKYHDLIERLEEGRKRREG